MNQRNQFPKQVPQQKVNQASDGCLNDRNVDVNDLIYWFVVYHNAYNSKYKYNNENN